MNRGHKLLLAAALGFAVTRAALADPTAFDLIKKGDDYIGVQSKDKVVQIHSDKSVASLTPNIWHVAYYDPDAPFRFVEVKFGAGEKMDVAHPGRPFQAPYSEGQILEKSKLKVDSDKALKIAAAQPLLKNLKLTAAKLTLDHGDAGPVWSSFPPPTARSSNPICTRTRWTRRSGPTVCRPPDVGARRPRWC
jgi:hypothetical protein